MPGVEIDAQRINVADAVEHPRGFRAVNQRTQWSHGDRASQHGGCSAVRSEMPDEVVTADAIRVAIQSIADLIAEAVRIAHQCQRVIPLRQTRIFQRQRAGRVVEAEAAKFDDRVGGQLAQFDIRGVDQSLIHVLIERDLDGPWPGADLLAFSNRRRFNDGRHIVDRESRIEGRDRASRHVADSTRAHGDGKVRSCQHRQREDDFVPIDSHSGRSKAVRAVRHGEVTGLDRRDQHVLIRADDDFRGNDPQ